MIRPSTHYVRPEHGPAPAGEPDQCFHCREKVGTEHALNCVMRVRTVVLQYGMKVLIAVPEHWTKEKIEFRYNASTWCATNSIDSLRLAHEALGKVIDAVDRSEAEGGQVCLCPGFSVTFLREASEEEDRLMDGDLVP